MPYLTEKYGLLPWHFGGEESLTDAEIDAYLRHYRESQKREQAAARKTPGAPARGTSRRSPRR